MLPRFLVDMHIHVARSFIICVMLCRSLFVLLSLFFGNWLPPKWRTFACSFFWRSPVWLTVNSPFGITATTDGSYGKTNLELQPVVVSEIPNDKEELEAYLRLTGLPGVRVSKPFCFCFVFLLVSFEGLPFSCQLPQFTPHTHTHTFLCTSKSWLSPACDRCFAIAYVFQKISDWTSERQSNFRDLKNRDW